MARLTKRAVETLARGDRDAFLWDAALPGFGIRVTPAGVRTYVVQYRIAGRSRRLALGRHGRLTPEQARKLAAERLAEVAAGRDPAAERQEARMAGAAPATVADVAGAWKVHQRARVVKGKLRARTLAEYERQLAAEILPRLGKRKLGEITAADAQRLHDELAARRVLANRCLDLLSALWRWAEEQGLASGPNPCRRVERNEEPRRARHLTHEELARLGAKADALVAARKMPARVGLLVRLIALTGCRPGEIKGLAWTDVDLGRRVLRLKDAKTGDRDVWIAEPTKAALEALRALPTATSPGKRRKAVKPQESPWCFPSPRDPSRPVKEFRKPWAALLEAAKIAHTEPYVLRHTYASESEALSISPYLTAELLGHARGRRDVTRGYVHHVPEDVRRASERVAQRIAAALDGDAPSKGEPFRGAGVVRPRGSTSPATMASYSPP
jgi:integrase